MKPKWTPQIHTKAEEFGGFHNTTLTHVIFTLSSWEEVPVLEETIGVWWQKYWPCENWDVMSQCTSKEVYPQDRKAKPHLVILLAPQLGSAAAQRLKPLISTLALRQCFASAVVRYLQASSSDLSLGEIVLRGSCLGDDQQVGYGLFLSSNARPTKPNWLTTLAFSVLFPVPAYWMIVPFPSIFPKMLNEKSTLAMFRLSTDPKQNSLRRRRRRRRNEEEDDFCIEEFPPAAERDTFPHMYFSQLRPFARETVLAAHNATDSRIFSLQTYLHYYLFYGFKRNYELVRFQLANRVMVSRLLAEGVNAIDSSEAVLLASINRSTNAFYPVAAQETIHDSSITHLVMAFNNVPSQFVRLRNTLTVWWERFPPCRGPGDQKILHAWRTNCNSNTTTPPPDLVFMVSRRSMFEFEQEAVRNDLLLEKHIREEIFPLIPEHSKPCFGAIQVCIVRLTQRTDSYLTGSRILFERFLRGECTKGRGSVDHALYIEPDARPVKLGWLSALSSSVVYPNPKSWIIGSIFQGSEQLTKWNPPPDWIFHFNGNGIYQLKRETRSSNEKLGLANFHDFYFYRVRPYMISIQGAEGESAMDIDITTYVMSTFDPKRNEKYRLPEQARLDEYLQKIEFDALLRNLPRDDATQGKNDVDAVARFVTNSRFSNLIVNKYQSKWHRSALREEAQLVHGGYCGQECQG